MSNQTQTSPQDCCICLQPAQPRSGFEFLTTPGCCGKWFHQSCLSDYIAKGGTQCPLCKTAFPASVLSIPVLPSVPGMNITPPSIQQQIPIQQLQQQIPMQQQSSSGGLGVFSSWFGNRFGRPSQSVNNSFLQESPRTTFDVTEEPITAGVTKPKAVKSEDLKKDISKENVILTLTPEFRTISLNQQTLHVRAALEFPDVGVVNENEDRNPLDIIFVLDVSGSMSGSKIFSLRKAVKFVTSVLGDSDRMAIITFNSSAELRMGLKHCTSSRKNIIEEELLPRMDASGGTSIFDGLNKAVDLLTTRKSRNDSTAVFLLSDGQDTDNASQQCEYAGKIRSAGASFFVFGLGADHDSAHLQRLANAGEGTFIFVDRDEAVVDAFGGAIGTQQGGILRNLTVQVTVPEGVSVGTVQSGRYPHTINSNGADVRFADLYVGERRDFLLRLNVSSASTDCEALIASAIANYTVRTHDHEVTAQSSDVLCVVRRVAASALTLEDLTRNVDVDVELCRVNVMQAIESAVLAADRDHIEEGKRILNTAKETLTHSICVLQNHPLSRSLVQDLEDCIRRLESRASYNQMGGRAQMTEHLDSYSKQRNVYSKNDNSSIYQTTRSATNQKKASLF